MATSPVLPLLQPSYENLGYFAVEHTFLVPLSNQQPPQWMSKTSESAREGFDDDSGSSPLKSAIFTSCFYFRVINYLANFTRAVPLHSNCSSE